MDSDQKDRGYIAEREHSVKEMRQIIWGHDVLYDRALKQAAFHEGIRNKFQSKLRDKLLAEMGLSVATLLVATEACVCHDKANNPDSSLFGIGQIVCISSAIVTDKGLHIRLTPDLPSNGNTTEWERRTRWETGTIPIDIVVKMRDAYLEQ